MTLTDFLLARIAEDEAGAKSARAVNGGHWWTKDVEPWGLAIEGSDAAEGNPRAHSGDPELWDHEGAIGMHPETARHVVAWKPDRVLAECEAKRQIVEQARKVAWIEEQGHVTDYSTGERDAILSVLSILALPYADHPDCREEWKR